MCRNDEDDEDDERAASCGGSVEGRQAVLIECKQVCKRHCKNLIEIILIEYPPSNWPSSVARLFPKSGTCSLPHATA